MNITRPVGWLKPLRYRVKNPRSDEFRIAPQHALTPEFFEIALGKRHHEPRPVGGGVQDRHDMGVAEEALDVDLSDHPLLRERHGERPLERDELPGALAVLSTEHFRITTPGDALQQPVGTIR